MRLFFPCNFFQNFWGHKANVSLNFFLKLVATNFCSFSSTIKFFSKLVATSFCSFSFSLFKVFHSLLAKIKKQPQPHMLQPETDRKTMYMKTHNVFFFRTLRSMSCMRDRNSPLPAEAAAVHRKSIAYFPLETSLPCDSLLITRRVDEMMMRNR